MHKLTNQEAFDKALTGILAQGLPSIGDDGCVYRQVTSCGAVRRCGVGWLIDDDTASDWDRDMVAFREVFNRDSLFIQEQRKKAIEAMVATPLADVEPLLLDDLQSAHDEPGEAYYFEHGGGTMAERDFVVPFMMNMWLIAKMYGLEFEL